MYSLSFTGFFFYNTKLRPKFGCQPSCGWNPGLPVYCSGPWVWPSVTATQWASSGVLLYEWPWRNSHLRQTHVSIGRTSKHSQVKWHHLCEQCLWWCDWQLGGNWGRYAATTTEVALQLSTTLSKSHNRIPSKVKSSNSLASARTSKSWVKW